MNISPSEAEETLEVIRSVAKRMRKAISTSGAYAFFIIWGVVWLIGFLGNQFLPSSWIGWVWLVIDALGGIASWVVGARMSRGVRSNAQTGKRIAWFWILLLVYLVAVMGVMWPFEVQQVAMAIVLFVMVGWMAMSLLMSFGSIRLTLGITALALVGYFLLPVYFYLIMAILCGGGLIVFGLYVKARW